MSGRLQRLVEYDVERQHHSVGHAVHTAQVVVARFPVQWLNSSPTNLPTSVLTTISHVKLVIWFPQCSGKEPWRTSDAVFCGHGPGLLPTHEALTSSGLHPPLDK